MGIIFIDGVFTDEVYYLKNKNKETCGYCKHCKLNDGKSMYSVVGRCNLNNLRKHSDEWCGKFDKR